MKLSQVLRNFHSTIFIILVPLLALPLPVIFRNTVASCGFCIIVVAGYWVTECLPLAVTSLIPLILFPLMGVMSVEEVSTAYMRDTVWLFVGGLTIAVAVEHTGLHRRIAISVLLLVGTSPQSLMLGFMLPTYFLSMWITNTATTAMMLPVAAAVLAELRKDQPVSNETPDEIDSPAYENDIAQQSNSAESFSQGPPRKSVGRSNFSTDGKATEGPCEATDEELFDDQEENVDRTVRNVEDAERDGHKRGPTSVEKGLTICVPYAATIGGIATITGTGPNAVIAGHYPILFPDAEPHINFGNWMAYHLPLSLLMLGMAYVWLLRQYIGIKVDCKRRIKTDTAQRIKIIFRKEYQKLGSIKWSEGTVIAVFVGMISLWLLRDPGFITGWSVMFKDGFVKDGTVAITVSSLLFILPSRKPLIFGKLPADRDDIQPVPAVLNWRTVHAMFPWDILFLLGGGFVIAEGATASGFSDWLATQLSFLEGVPNWAICLIVTLIMGLFTECTSNVATASLFVPIVAQLAQVIEVHPLYLLLPTVVATSFAFVLPAATAANAIALSFGYLKVMDLVKSGWMLNLLGVIVVMLFIHTYADVMYGVNSFPEWAALNYTSRESVL